MEPIQDNILETSEIREFSETTYFSNVLSCDINFDCPCPDSKGLKVHRIDNDGTIWAKMGNEPVLTNVNVDTIWAKMGNEPVLTNVNVDQQWIINKSPNGVWIVPKETYAHVVDVEISNAERYDFAMRGIE